MADVLQQITADRSVVSRPAVKLFCKDAPEVTITVLRAAFSDVEDVVEIELLHSRTDALL